MKLPNGERAIVDPAKLRDYCLNRHHRRGRHKARVFAAALGITVHQTEKLSGALILAAQTSNAELGEQDAYGRRFMLDFDMEGPQGLRRIRSLWIIRNGEDFPRFVSCYVL